MLNNIFLIDLPENELNDIKELCNSALLSVQGADAQVTFISINEKEGKMQLRFNAGRSSTFMCVVSRKFANTYEYQLENVFKLKVMYIYEDLESFKNKLKDNFLIFDTETTQNNAYEQKEEPNPNIEDEVKVVEEVEEVEENGEFSINNVAEESEDIDYLKARIRTLEASNDNYKQEIDLLRSQIDSDLREQYILKEKEYMQKVVNLTKELTELKAKVSAIEKESAEKGVRISQLNLRLEEVTAENEVLSSKNEELEAMVDDTSEKNIKIENVMKEKEETERAIKQISDELIAVRNNYDTAKEALAESEKKYIALSDRYDRIASSKLARLSEKAAIKSAINDILLEHSFIKDCYLIGAGSNDCINDTAYYISSAVKNSTSNTLVIDLEYDTFVDYYLQVVSTSEFNLIDYMEGKVDNFKKCILPTGKKNIKYCRLTTGFINDSCLLSLNWEKLVDLIDSYEGRVIIHIGSINGVFKGILINTFCRFMKVHTVSKITTVNLRNQLITLSGIKNITNLTCICIKPNTKVDCPAYDKLAKKYVTKVVSRVDNISL